MAWIDLHVFEGGETGVPRCPLVPGVILTPRVKSMTIFVAYNKMISFIRVWKLKVRCLRVVILWRFAAVS